MAIDTDKTALFDQEGNAKAALDKLVKRTARYYEVISQEVVEIVDYILGSDQLAESVRMIEAGALDLPLPQGYWEDGNFYKMVISFQGIVTFENTDRDE